MAENADLRAEVDALREHIENLERQGTKQWIQENLEEAQQLIDNIVGIKGITENPLKAAAELEGRSILTRHTDTTNTTYRGDKNVISATTSGTLGRQVVIPPHEELYGY
jgi:cell division septum initiation protein DivIVA